MDNDFMAEQAHITINPFHGRCRWILQERVVADTRAALVLQEGTLPPVFYVPVADVDMSVLVSNEHRSHCPYKGDARYWDYASGDHSVTDIAWAYPEPMAAAAPIKDHLAFYEDKFDQVVKTPSLPD